MNSVLKYVWDKMCVHKVLTSYPMFKYYINVYKMDLCTMDRSTDS